MHLIVGLGNPGKKYDGTRHNVGFDVVECLAQRHGFPALKVTRNAAVSKGSIQSEDAILARPLTYMNLSGDAVGPLMRYYKISPGNIVVIHDELDFEPGFVKLKSGGGHGGHNGLRSIMQHCGAEFARVRLGIGKPSGSNDGADFVLSRFGKKSRPLIEEAVESAADAVELVIEHGVKTAMNVFNKKASSTTGGDLTCL